MFSSRSFNQNFVWSNSDVSSIHIHPQHSCSMSINNRHLGASTLTRWLRQQCQPSTKSPSATHTVGLTITTSFDPCYLTPEEIYLNGMCDLETDMTDLVDLKYSCQRVTNISSSCIYDSTATQNTSSGEGRHTTFEWERLIGKIW